VKLNNLVLQFNRIKNKPTIKAFIDEYSGVEETKSSENTSLIQQNQQNVYSDDQNQYIELMERIEIRNLEFAKIAEGLHNIDKMTNDLALLVTEQNIVLEQIEANIISSSEFIKKGKEELIVAKKNATSSNKFVAGSLGLVLLLGAGLGAFFGLRK
jgi:hypothetical protein